MAKKKSRSKKKIVAGSASELKKQLKLIQSILDQLPRRIRRDINKSLLRKKLPLTIIKCGVQVIIVNPDGTTETTIKARSKGKIRAGGREQLWTSAEERRLAKLYPTKTAKQIAKILDRKVSSVENKIFALGLSKRKAKPWSRAEIARLKKLYKNYSASQMAKKLKRSFRSVKSKIDALNLKKPMASKKKKK